jgi:2-polyprenyl-3-methyl-5-hydroxy-6-metoxy-1,4-benzoquinol methylase/ribosomal protein S27E
MKEEDIRPQELFDTYLSLAGKDVTTYFRDSPFHFIRCPACDGDKSVFQFRKLFFDYEECSTCGTLFVNPRPGPETFAHYYSSAPSVQFWATHFYRETETARREQVVRPKAERVRDAIARHLGSLTGDACIVDIGAGYGLFCEEFQKFSPPGIPVIAIEPAGLLAEACRRRGITTVPKFLEEVTPGDIGGNVAVATSFELLEHLQDPGHFIRKCHEIVMEGGLVVLTTLSWSGFDLQVLREKSRSIHPPHHINFFTPGSLRTLLDRNGFRTLEITTPGLLDMDIVRKQRDAVTDPFLKILMDADDRTRDLFQAFLRDAGLSSHMMAVAMRG